MWWAAVIQMGMQVFGATKEQSAARDARDIAYDNMDAQILETKEEMRRAKAENKQIVGFATAAANSSGFSIKAGTSQQSYIDELEAEGKRQVQWIQDSGVRKARILQQGGSLAYSEGQARAMGGYADAIGSFGGMMGGGGGGGGMWGTE
jgi:hypothetical protein